MDAIHPQTLTPDGSPELGDDLIWGVRGIAAATGLTPRQAFHQLENGRLPARKIGGRWCSSRLGLRRFFASVTNGEVTSHVSTPKHR